MEKNQIKLRINLESREFEVEGDSNYINERFGNTINEYMDSIKFQKKAELPLPIKRKEGTNMTPLNNQESQLNKNSLTPDSFGEYFSRFGKSLGMVDKLLVSCFFVQSKNLENIFTLKEATGLLLDQGVKLSNANAFNKANIDTKRIFKLSGKNYRVSEIGVDYINNLSTA